MASWLFRHRLGQTDEPASHQRFHTHHPFKVPNSLRQSGRQAAKACKAVGRFCARTQVHPQTVLEAPAHPTKVMLAAAWCRMQTPSLPSAGETVIGNNHTTHHRQLDTRPRLFLLSPTTSSPQPTCSPLATLKAVLCSGHPLLSSLNGRRTCVD